MAEHAVRDLAANPPTESMHDRAYEAGALIWCEHSDGAQGEASENEQSHEDAP
jgi:hypothetical protein